VGGVSQADQGTWPTSQVKSHRVAIGSQISTLIGCSMWDRRVSINRTNQHVIVLPKSQHPTLKLVPPFEESCVVTDRDGLECREALFEQCLLRSCFLQKPSGPCATVSPQNPNIQLVRLPNAVWTRFIYRCSSFEHFFCGFCDHYSCFWRRWNITIVCKECCPQFP